MSWGRIFAVADPNAARAFLLSLSGERFYPAPPPKATHFCSFSYAAWYAPSYYRIETRLQYFDGEPRQYRVIQLFCKDVATDWVTWYGGKGRWLDTNWPRHLEPIPRVPFVGAWYQP